MKRGKKNRISFRHKASIPKDVLRKNFIGGYADAATSNFLTLLSVQRGTSRTALLYGMVQSEMKKWDKTDTIQQIATKIWHHWMLHEWNVTSTWSNKTGFDESTKIYLAVVMDELISAGVELSDVELILDETKHLFRQQLAINAGVTHENK